ncbi:MAG: dTDP-4-dehydrorhamnose reductase [Timaviella obliquedivisa GSE-PSE-MK23-08B]|nr:dTDP-4-dehydrorhamnose reductase [Timaviella obliquedivisa GSE-PSE-MK23-08B]
MKDILLIGKMGQVGQELQRTLANIGKITSVGHESLDLSQADLIRRMICDVQPSLIINAAAYTAVDKAESEPDLAAAINAEAPIVMAEEAQQIGASLIHISTDYVFDGHKNTPYLENDVPNPVSVYGKTKLAGEAGISQVYAQSSELPYAILRTAWVYGTRGKGNFAKTMLRLGAERDEVRVVADQIGSPTSASDIARAIATLSTHFLSPLENDVPTGIYHFTNSGVASWYDFAVAIFEEARALGVSLKCDRVVPITTQDYPTPAIRPAYSVLSCQKISTVLEAFPIHWRQALRQMLTEFYSQPS